MGVKKWIDLQLHPERIPENPELARGWSRSNRCVSSRPQAVRRYPNPQMIRAVARAAQPMPDDPVDTRGCGAPGAAYQT